MASIIEFFGYSPGDKSEAAQQARANRECPFLGERCTKTLRDGQISGACTMKPATSGPVICCPIRLYAGNYQILLDVARIAFGPDIPLLPAAKMALSTGERIAVFGKRWGKELRLPTRGRAGGYSVDWVLARVSASGDLVDFVAIEVQSIDTTGNYQAERTAYINEQPFMGRSTANLNWENVNKRILPQLIYKGHVLRQEPLCQKGLFFVCPTPVYQKFNQRLGGDLAPYPLQPGTLTILWYDIGPPVSAGQSRDLVPVGRFTTTVDQVALAFTAPKRLPPPQSYESAIRAELS